jgi:hypothetical protein
MVKGSRCIRSRGAVVDSSLFRVNDHTDTGRALVSLARMARRIAGDW